MSDKLEGRKPFSDIEGFFSLLLQQTAKRPKTEKKKAGALTTRLFCFSRFETAPPSLIHQPLSSTSTSSGSPQPSPVEVDADALYESLQVSLLDLAFFLFLPSSLLLSCLRRRC